MPLAPANTRRYSYAIGEDSGRDGRRGALDDGGAVRRPARTRGRSTSHARARDDDDDGTEDAGIDIRYACGECRQHAFVDDVVEHDQGHDNAEHDEAGGYDYQHRRNHEGHHRRNDGANGDADAYRRHSP